MDTSYYQRVKKAFMAACDVAPDERPRVLDLECGDDAGLRADVESLLDHESRPRIDFEDASSRLLEQLARDGRTALQPAVERIGDYRILDVLGQGGMGVVYLARQDNPDRDVALKVIRGGLLSPALLHRFEREAQVLGRLHHPGIAQVYEAGTADQGAAGHLPYFAMEYVRGLPLLKYAAEHHLAERDRLELMARVGEAVEHAHQHGVVHRDLKPANILVEDVADRAQPRILDFGIARLIDTDVRMTTLQTQTGEFVGTLPYMSPEQIEGDRGLVDRRADVYALGVITFQLLTGRLPLDLKDRSMAEAARIITRDEPTRLGTLSRALRGDVETIVAKALEKDPDRRYQTAGEMAADIRRLLGHEPIVARPPGTWYQARKFARRNRALVAGVVAVFVVLVLGIVATSWQAIVANRHRVRAEDEAASSLEISNFLHEALSSIDPAQAQGREVTVRMALDQAAAKLESEPFRRPLVQASLHRTIGLTYKAIGEYESAEHHLRRARDLNLAALGPGHADTLDAENELVLVLDGLFRFDEAESLARDAIARSEASIGADTRETSRLRTALANVLFSERKLDDAEELYRQTLEFDRRMYGPTSRETLIAMSNLGLCLTDLGRLDEAEKLLADCARLREESLGPDHPETLYARNNLAKLRLSQGRFADAEPIMRDLVARAGRVLGAKHPHTLQWERNLAITLLNLGRIDEAAAVLEAARPNLTIDGADTFPDHIQHLGLLAMCYLELNRLDEAEALATEVRDLSIQVYGPDHLETIRSATLFYDLYDKRGDIAKRDEWAEKLKGTPFDPNANDAD